MDEEISNIGNRMNTLSGSKMSSNVLSTSSKINYQVVDTNQDSSTTDNNQRSRYNSSDGSSDSYLNSIFNSMQSWQSGQSVNTWMPQTL